ncbi:MAG: hypothetical protein PVH19_02345 [Planctomycetia bacterium]|jgi:cell division protein FtsB
MTQSTTRIHWNAVGATAAAVGVIITVAGLLIVAIISHVRLESEVAHLQQENETMKQRNEKLFEDVRKLKTFNERLGSAQKTATSQAISATIAAQRAELAVITATQATEATKLEATRVTAELKALTPEGLKKLVKELTKLQSTKEARDLLTNLTKFKELKENLDKRIGNCATQDQLNEKCNAILNGKDEFTKIVFSRPNGRPANEKFEIYNDSGLLALYYPGKEGKPRVIIYQKENPGIRWIQQSADGE